MGTRGGFLETEEFELLIEDLGELPAFWHRKVGPCPRCVDAVGGFDSRDPACPNCSGAGTIYKVMTLPTQGLVIAVNAMVGKTRSPVPLLGGEVVMIYNPDNYPLVDGDRIGFSSRVVGDQDLLRRDEAGTGTMTDRLRYRPVVALLNVFGGDDELTTGFSVATDKSGVTWTGSGDTPSVGDDYVVCYQYHLTYLVDRDAFHHRIKADDGSSFPNRITLRLDQLAPTDTGVGIGP